MFVSFLHVEPKFTMHQLQASASLLIPVCSVQLHQNSTPSQYWAAYCLISLLFEYVLEKCRQFVFDLERANAAFSANRSLFMQTGISYSAHGLGHYILVE